MDERAIQPGCGESIPPTPISGQEGRLVYLLSIGMHLDLCYSGH